MAMATDTVPCAWKQHRPKPVKQYGTPKGMSSPLTGILWHAVKRIPRGVRRALRSLTLTLWELAALCDLWAIRRRWIKQGKGRIFEAAGVYLAQRWGVCRRTADRFIHRLEEMGVIEVVDRGWRYGARKVRLYVKPKPVVCLDKIKRDRADVRKRQVRSGCAHSITEDRAVLPPPNLSDPFFTVSDDPEGVWAGEIEPDPFPELLVASQEAAKTAPEIAIGFVRPPGEPEDLYPLPFAELPADPGPCWTRLK